MTKQEYLTLVEDFIAKEGDANYQKQSLLVTRASDYFDKTGKLLSDFTEVDLYDFFVNLTGEKLFKYRTIVKMYEITDGFYRYLQEREIIMLNPAASVRPTDFAKRVVENSVIVMPYYKRADVEQMIERQPDNNKALVAAVMLSYYEGVASDSNELIELKRSDFNYNDRTIMTPRGIRKVSQKLANAYRDLEDVYVFSSRHTRSMSGYRDYPVHPATEGSIIKVATSSNKRKAIIQSVTVILKGIQEEIGSQMDRYILYYEGFLEYMCNEVGEETAAYLLRGGRKSQAEVNKVIKLIEDYQFNMPYAKISETLEPYVIALKARYRNFSNS